ncbi:MAG: sensor histidine kinase [Slackia sp.]|nr:sensor histidine kinase [Slackia sp.]
MNENNEHTVESSAQGGETSHPARDFLMSLLGENASGEGGIAGPRELASMRPRDWAVDVATALVAFVFGCVQLVLASTSVIYVDGPFREMAGLVNIVPNEYAYAALAFTTLPLVLRRVAAWPTLVIVLACFFFSSGFMSGYALSAVGPILAAFTVACELGGRHAAVAGVLTAAVMLVAPTPLPSETLAAIMRVQNAVFSVAGVSAGFAVRAYRAYAEETKRRLLAAERGREELAARRVAEERVRIARDVHDITAHSLSAVTIQAAAAERLIDIDSAAAKEAIVDIRAVSKGALEEIRSMVGVLRGGEAAQTAPAEGTERLDDVVAYLERAGLAVACSTRGYEKSQVPAFIDMALFSLVREAATNTVRHAKASRVEVTLRSTAALASLSYSDDGIGFGADVLENAQGHGIQGMAERIGALGGRFEVSGEGGFFLSADIPIEGVRDGR